MKQKNSNQNIFSQYTGRNVEIMLRPDLPVITGKVVECNENFISVGDALLAYPMIWSIRPLDDEDFVIEKAPEVKKIPEPAPVEPVIEIPKVVEKIPETKPEIIISEPEPEVKEVKEVKKEKKDWKDKIFEGELVQFHPKRKYGSIYCSELKDYGVPTVEPDRIFVHANQIVDENLKEDLLQRDKNDNSFMIRVTFKISMNEKGACADEVRAKGKIIPSKQVFRNPEPEKTKSELIPVPAKTKSEDESNLSFEQLLERNLDWKSQTFEGDLVSFNHERNFGLISCAEIERYVNNSEDNEGNFNEKVFVHMNQIRDIDLRQKLLDEKNPRPNIRVLFEITENEKGLRAKNVRSKFVLSNDVLQVQTLSALYEEGEIEYFRRYEPVPHGKIRTEGNKLYKFYEESITDPALLVFLECSPSAEGQKVRFIKTKKGKDIIIQNMEAAEPFPETRLKDWENSGLLQKAREKLHTK